MFFNSTLARFESDIFFPRGKTLHRRNNRQIDPLKENADKHKHQRYREHRSEGYAGGANNVEENRRLRRNQKNRKGNRKTDPQHSGYNVDEIIPKSFITIRKRSENPVDCIENYAQRCNNKKR